MSNRILLVDDEPDFLSVIRMRLSKAGYDVICAHHGKDALERLKLKKPDIIITDVMMPVMDGVDLFQELKNDPETKKIPIIVITVKDKLEESFKAVGVDEFIAKPFEIDELLRKIQKCIVKSAVVE